MRQNQNHEAESPGHKPNHEKHKDNGGHIGKKKESDNDAEGWAYTISQKNAPLGSVQSAMNSPSKA